MITLEDKTLTFRFDDVHPEAKCAVTFMRTARIPDDDRTYPLPAGLGRFPLRHVDDCVNEIGAGVRRRGGVALPMHASEALWIYFEARSAARYPIALKIAAGKVNAITGKPWTADLCDDPQDYLVVPEQPWLDGFCIAKGIIRQFVAERLGAGYSVEEQLTGKAEFGGLQIIAYPMKRRFYDELQNRRRREAVERVLDKWEPRLTSASLPVEAMKNQLQAFRNGLNDGIIPDLNEVTRKLSESWEAIQPLRQSPAHEPSSHRSFPMAVSSRSPYPEQAAAGSFQGLAAGGRMTQEIHADPYGIDAWDTAASSRCFVTLLAAADWPAVFGEAVTTAPLSMTDYQKLGLPWFDHYAPAAPAVNGGKLLAQVKSWATVKAFKGEAVRDNSASGTLRRIHIGPAKRPANVVHEADI